MSETTPVTKSAHELELDWVQNTLKRDVPDLTLRAVIMGAFLGGFMSLSNLYVGLKTGWGLGVAITACILSYAIWRILFALRFVRSDMTLLENACMQTTASSAGYSTGGTMVSGVAAYLMITGTHMPVLTLALWTMFLAALGVFMAIPMKRQMVNVEQLKFPSGIAAAETLKSLYSEGRDAVLKARSLAAAGGLGGLVAWFRDAGKPFAIPSSIPIPGSIAGVPLAKYTFTFDMSTIMIAAGAIMGVKMTTSMLIGATINYGVLAPWMAQLGAIDGEKIGYREIVRWSTWAGASIMVTSGLFAFATQWRTVMRAFSGIAGVFKVGGGAAKDDPVEAVEVPSSWFLLGTLVAGSGCVGILMFAFDTQWYMGIVAVLMTFFLALVACRATGESDITPIGAMGKITQLMFGILAPSKTVTNLMTASVTAGAAGASADLLTVYKTGHMIGLHPRKQFLAQFLGIFAGTLVVVPAFYLLVPTVDVLGSDQWPAPSAQVWAAVARLLATGFEALHPTARWGLVIGGLIGVIIPALEIRFPKVRPYLPSAMGLGLSMVIPFFNSLSMFIGALIAFIIEKYWPKMGEMYTIPVASGLIAGESILGVVIAILASSGLI